jgi:hypothetical protein
MPNASVRIRDAANAGGLMTTQHVTFAARTGLVAIATVLISSAAVHAQPAGTPRPSPPSGIGAPGIPSRPPGDAIRPSAGTALLRGRVVQAETGAPIRGARVTLSQAPVQSRSVLTDDEGRYEFDAVARGSYTLSASKAGFVTLEYGQRRGREPAQRINIADRAVVDAVDFSLPRGGAIEGQVLDEYGEPAVGVGVQVMRERYVDGERQMGPAGGSSSLTDDLGRFRVHGIPAGDYYLGALVRMVPSPGSGDAVSIGPGTALTYHPASVSPREAQRLTVGAGHTLTGIAIQLRPARPAAISGVVRDAAGRPAQVPVTLWQPGGGTSRGSMSGPDGSFSFSNLAPGEYVVTASIRRQAQGQGPESGFSTLTLAGGDASVVVVTAVGRTARGRVVFDGAVPEPGSIDGRVQIRLTPFQAGPQAGPMADSPAPVRPDAEWRFEVPDLFDRTAIDVLLPDGWYVKSLRRNGEEMARAVIDASAGDVEGLEIELSQRATEIRGIVADGRSTKGAETTVLIFADERRLWGGRSRYVQTARPDENGQYMVRALPPGRYLAIAVDAHEDGDETHPEHLEALRRVATSFTLGDGESRNVDLRVEPSP